MEFTRSIEPQLFEPTCDKNPIHFPLPDDAALNEKVMTEASFNQVLLSL